MRRPILLAAILLIMAIAPVTLAEHGATTGYAYANPLQFTAAVGQSTTVNFSCFVGTDAGPDSNSAGFEIWRPFPGANYYENRQPAAASPCDGSYTNVPVTFDMEGTWVAVADNGMGHYTETEIVVNSGTAPDAPQNVAVTFPDASTARVTWSAPSNHGSSTVTQYQVYSDTEAANLGSVGPSTFYFDHAGTFAEATNYCYKVRASNTEMTGAYSSSVCAQRPAPAQSPVACYSFVATDLSVAFNGGCSYDPDGSISSYHWNFGDGWDATGSSPTHVFDAAGTYTVAFTVTDNAGLQDAELFSVTVSAGTTQTQTTTSTTGTGIGGTNTTTAAGGGGGTESAPGFAYLPAIMFSAVGAIFGYAATGQKGNTRKGLAIIAAAALIVAVSEWFVPGTLLGGGK